MRMTVDGIDKTEMREFVSAFSCFCSKRLSLYKHYNLNIHVEFCDIDAKLRGYVIRQNDNDFEIVVKDSMSCENMLRTVAHELVHVRQHVEKNLDELLDKEAATPYNDRWWEKEAVFLSNRMYTEFVEKHAVEFVKLGYTNFMVMMVKIESY